MTHPLVEQLRFARSEFGRSLAGTGGDDARRRLGPMNGLSWMVGHLADQEQRHWLERQGRAPVVPGHNALVGYGKPASTPDLDEVWHAWHTIISAAIPYLDALTVADLQQFPPILRLGSRPRPPAGFCRRHRPGSPLPPRDAIASRVPPSWTASRCAPRKKGPRGYDGAKKLSGGKHHLLVDTLGLLLEAVAHAADLRDREGAKLALARARERIPRRAYLWVDAGYQGPTATWIEQEVELSVTVTR